MRLAQRLKDRTRRRALAQLGILQLIGVEAPDRVQVAPAQLGGVGDARVESDLALGAEWKELDERREVE